MDIKLIDRCKPKLSVDESIEVLQTARSNWRGYQRKWLYESNREVGISLFEGEPYLAIVEDT